MSAYDVSITTEYHDVVRVVADSPEQAERRARLVPVDGFPMFSDAVVVDIVRAAWGTCPACGSKMGTNEAGVETCPDPACDYHRGAPA